MLGYRKAQGVKSLPGPSLLTAGGVWLCIRPGRLQSSHPLPSGVFPYTIFVGPKRQFVSACVCVCVLDCVHTRSHLEGVICFLHLCGTFHSGGGDSVSTAPLSAR